MTLRALPVLGFLASATALSAGPSGLDTSFSRYVDAQGNISLPEGVRRDWVHLGSWVVDDAEAPGHGFHDVYTQAEALAAYRDTGRFPDGAVLVKEIRAIESAPMTTGQAQWAGDPQIWFVMIKDRESRFPDSPHWGGGWGWALYKAGNTGTNVSKGWESECLSCHVPARDNDYVYIEGYPSLNDKPVESGVAR